MNINEIFKECAKIAQLHSFMYARLDEANYLMDDTMSYPVLLRLFNETISETSTRDVYKRKTTLYFCDALGKAEPNTETEVMPVVQKMESRAMTFIAELRKHGVEVDMISNMTPYYGRFDALVAGVTVEVTMTYRNC